MTTRIDYTATLLVAWAEGEDVPETYTFDLPIDNTEAGLTRFFEAYHEDCVDWNAHPTNGSMWYYYRPARSGCDIAAEDVLTTTASVSISEVNTTGQYPEYDRIWEDGALNVVAIFGKNEDGATDNWDAGIRGYNNVVRAVRNLYANDDLTTTPAEFPEAPGVEVDDITFEVTLEDGRQVTITTLLVDNVRTAPESFTRRYEGLSGNADLIIYNGHAGLGSNIRALANKGKWNPGQYSIVFMNGCDTYAYVDNALFLMRAPRLTPMDPTRLARKHLDIVTNALPALLLATRQPRPEGDHGCTCTNT